MDVLIVSATRSPIGAFQGSLSTLPASVLGSTIIRSLLSNVNIPFDNISEVVIGQTLTAGQYQNPARQASIGANLPNSIPAYTVNMVCGSGLKAIVLGYQSIRCGDSQIVIAGGQESMSLAPHAIHLRNGVKFGNVESVDTMITDGLTDAFNKYHMGVTAENVATKYEVSRIAQDEFSVQSQQKCADAVAHCAFSQEICSVTVKTRKGDVIVTNDEFPRPNTTMAALEKLKPAFSPTGTVTAGNASGLNDGAAALLMVNRESVEKYQLPVLCRIVSWAQVGVDPSIMGIGPIDAVRQALKKADWSIDSVDIFELNEAFAAQSVAVIKELGCDPKKVNVNGGGIALGHPIGASGARIVVTLIHIMLKMKSPVRGVAALCIGGGMGIAICLERT